MSGHRTEADYAAQVCQLADQNRALRSELAAALAAIRDFDVIAALHDKPGSRITLLQGLEVWPRRHAPIIALASQRKEPRK